MTEKDFEEIEYQKKMAEHRKKMELRKEKRRKEKRIHILLFFLLLLLLFLMGKRNSITELRQRTGKERKQ